MQFEISAAPPLIRAIRRSRFQIFQVEIMSQISIFKRLYEVFTERKNTENPRLKYCSCFAHQYTVSQIHPDTFGPLSLCDFQMFGGRP